ncbi:FtsH protease activity modulator HflK [Sphingomonas mesophila]|uniref:FtsH protease activity modulator HflK n=1 Tax=Sphingomonas mesophila TaxID=2303576 RepID=UPI000E570582|nr:FtsH protease activity modulator HflK [Sphingomonas mesophila]
MSFLFGWVARSRGLFADNKGPWGSPPSGGGGSDEPTPGPWGKNAPPKRPRGDGLGGGVSSLEEFLERNKRRFGGGGPGGSGGGGVPTIGDRSIYFWAAIGFVTLWLLFTTFHRIAPEERGVVTMFGRYHATLEPGIGMTLPAPISSVQKVNVAEIRGVDVGSATEETLVLTGDQNLVDIAYRVLWSIRDPEQFLFELRTPEDTISQVAESSMRQVVSQMSLNDVLGIRRGEIEARVRDEIQRTLERYQSGVIIRNVSIRQADPPGSVNEAFKDVTAAQQDAESEINKANAYALQLRQLAQGEATAFTKVYEQYTLAPDVTRKRMYYETMERILRNVEKTIVETPGVTPYLPINQMQQPRAPRPQQQQQGSGQ